MPKGKVGVEAAEEAEAEDADEPNENEGAGDEDELKEKLVKEGAVGLD